MLQNLTRRQLSKEVISKVTSKGQITLPHEIRKHLGVNYNDKVAFVIEPNGKIQVTLAKYPDIASLSGAAGSLKKSLPWKEMQRIAREDRLKEKYA